MQGGYKANLFIVKCPEKALHGSVLSMSNQGQMGRVFQLRVGSGLGIEKYFGSDWVLGIFIKYQVNRVLSGIDKNVTFQIPDTQKYPIILKIFRVGFGYC